MVVVRRTLGSLVRAGERIPVIGRPIIRVARRVVGRPAGGRKPSSPRPFQVVPAPRPVTVTASPPEIAEPMAQGRALAAEVESGERFDIGLFEALNAEYAARPVVPAALEYTHEALIERSVARLQKIHGIIDLADQRVLEFGCHHGYQVWYLSHAFGSDSWGVDVVERAPWPALADERTHFVLADLAVDRPFPEASFDRIVSINVFEHVTHPISSLEALFRVLRPGGLAWITANLHRGPLASHRYREVTFPWPHLLFGDDVFREFYRRRGLPEQGAEWVNRLTWEQYRSEMLRIGFVIRKEHLRRRAIDEELYQRFEPILGRYPRADLERDFFDVVVEKPPAQRRRFPR